MRVYDRRARLRAILTGDRFVRPASIYDALSARAAEALGYELLILTGSAASLAVLGAPDLALLTLSELAEQCRRITRATSLPLIVDADHGYGNALGVARCVEELEAAGVAGLSIEDTYLPRPFGGPDESFVSPEEGVGKLRAALAARTDPALVILGRTAAVRALGIESALQRAQAYEAAGVDGLFFSGLRTRAALEALRAACALPFVLSGTSPELQDNSYFVSQGVRIGGWDHRPIEAATAAMYETLRQSITGRETSTIDLYESDLMETLMRVRQYDQDIHRYLQ